MSRPGCGFDPSNASVRLTELARQGLTSGRIPVTAEDLRQMILGKFENPMLGLFGAHLLIPLLADESLFLQRPNNPEILKLNCSIQRVLGVPADGIIGPQTLPMLRRLLEEVVGNLEALLGDHPDVNALRQSLPGNENRIFSDAKVCLPPMLRRSWHTLVRSDPGYYRAKASSILARMADRIWGSGPWLVWEVPPAAPRKTDFDRERFWQIVSGTTERAAHAEKLESLLSKASLNTFEENIMRYSLSRIGGRGYQKKSPAYLTSPEAEPFEFEKDISEMANFYGIPVKTLERNLASAMTKINAAASSE